MFDRFWLFWQEFTYFCPPSLRKERLQQYRDKGQKRGLFPLPACKALPPAKKARLMLLANCRSPNGAANLQVSNLPSRSGHDLYSLGDWGSICLHKEVEVF